MSEDQSLLRAGVQVLSLSPGLGLNQVPSLRPGLGLKQEIPESPQMKEEPEEQSEVKQEEEQLPVISAREDKMFFNGSKDEYDLWEGRFLEHLHILNLKETILNDPASEAQITADRTKNPDCYAELIKRIDEKSLSLIRQEATDDGRKALKILREHYSGRSKPRIINLYTSLKKLRKAENESTPDYFLRAENLIKALCCAGETLSEGLIVAMVLGGLPDVYEPLAELITQNEDDVTFADFKRSLGRFEESEKINHVMKTEAKQEGNVHETNTIDQGTNSDDDVNMTCFQFGMKGHGEMEFTQQELSNFYKSNTHQESLCETMEEQENARKEETDGEASDLVVFSKLRPVPESSAVCVKREESSLLTQTELKEETQEEDVSSETHFHSDTEDTDNDDDWEPTSNISPSLVETGAVEKKHQCPFCPKAYCHKQGLQRHSRFHTGERPFSCSLCTKTFAHNATLVSHMRTHTGEKPYRCSICEKDFAHSSYFTKHVRKHSGADEDRKHQCPVCGKKFESKHKLRIHNRVHTGERPYSCSFCSKTFKQKGALDTHLRIHTGEKPFICSICNKKCAQKPHLDFHMRTHTGERPYSCSRCDKAYKDSSSLRNHMISHHGDAV